MNIFSYLCVTEGNQQQGQHITKNKRANHIDFFLVLIWPHFPAKGMILPSVKNVLVIHDRRCHGQREYPNHHHSNHSMLRHPDRGGLSGVHDGNVSVHGHGRQSEDADQHGHSKEIVGEFANEGAKHPCRHHVYGRLEGDAEEQVKEVCYAQVEDEYVGGAPWFPWFAPGQHGDHHGVAQHTECKDEPENQQRDEIIRADPE